MNCCWWIILLLVCRGNCGCGNNWSGSRRNRCEMNDCDMMYDQDYYRDDRSDDCGCMQNDYDSNMSRERMVYYETADCDCNENSMSYETFGCQENGIPCPPPIPTPYNR